MNERIKELAGQAKFMAEEDINKQISYNTELKAFAEKFAELIVRECIGVCEEYHGTAGDQAARYIGQGINEHFGVEE